MNSYQQNRIRISAYILFAIAFFIGLLMLGVMGALSIGIIGALGGTFTGAETALLFIGSGLSFFGFTTAIALHVAAGIGLLREKRWAKWLATAVATIQLFNFPIGTVAGGFILYTLHAKQEPSSKEASFNAA